MTRAHESEMGAGPWGKYRAELHRFILSRVKDPSQADDLVQDVIAKALSNQHQLQNAAKLRPWLYQITRNALVDHYRKQKPLTKEPSAALSLSLEGEREAEQELAGCLLPLLDELPAHYREAVRMAEFEGLPQRIVADRLGLSVSGAKSRVQRGRRMLRDVLLKCCRVELGARGEVLDYEARQDCTDCSSDQRATASEASGSASV